MSSDVFAKVGRGGAGNFYTKKDIQDAQAAQTEQKDLEAQAPSEPVLDSAALSSAQSGGASYARAGRGGAGNFLDRTTAADTLEREKQEAEKAQTLVASNLATKLRTGLSGRGGMGNWSDNAALDPGAIEQERKKAQDLETRVKEDVEAGLTMPPRAYQQHDREMEK